jgi:hypothetical protein
MRKPSARPQWVGETNPSSHREGAGQHFGRRLRDCVPLLGSGPAVADGPVEVTRAVPARVGRSLPTADFVGSDAFTSKAKNSDGTLSVVAAVTIQVTTTSAASWRRRTPIVPWPWMGKPGFAAGSVGIAAPVCLTSSGLVQEAGQGGGIGWGRRVARGQGGCPRGRETIFRKAKALPLLQGPFRFPDRYPGLTHARSGMRLRTEAL